MPLGQKSDQIREIAGLLSNFDKLVMTAFVLTIADGISYIVDD